MCCPGPSWSSSAVPYLGKHEGNEVLGSATFDLLLLAHAQQGVGKKGSCFSTWAGELISLQETTLTHPFASEGYSPD